MLFYNVLFSSRKTAYQNVLLIKKRKKKKNPKKVDRRNTALKVTISVLINFNSSHRRRPSWWLIKFSGRKEKKEQTFTSVREARYYHGGFLRNLRGECLNHVLPIVTYGIPEMFFALIAHGRLALKCFIVIASAAIEFNARRETWLRLNIRFSRVKCCHSQGRLNFSSSHWLSFYRSVTEEEERSLSARVALGFQSVNCVCTMLLLLYS